MTSGRAGYADATKEFRLGFQPIPLGLEQVVRRVEVLEKVELGLRLQREEPVLYRVSEARLRVRKYDRSPLGFLDHAEPTSGGLDPFLGYRVRIEERSSGNEEPMDMAQGVHDALYLDSSQRRREQRQLEALARCVHLGRSGDNERDLGA